MTAVAVIGTGRMGSAMAGTLVAAGFDVLLWNRTGTRAKALAADGCGRAMDTARDAATRADVTVCSLADDAAVRDAYEGPDGVVAGLRQGSVVVETSTIDPQTVHELGPRVEGAGAVLLDAPVSGSVPAARNGQLTFMVGGPVAGLPTAQPVLDALGAAVFHVGPLGAGATMKLAVNAVVHAINVTVSEALVLAERAGVDRATAYDVFAASAGGAPFVTYKRAAFLEPESTPVAFSLDLVLKDLELIAALAQRVELPLPQALCNLDIVRRAVDAGLGARDMSVIAEFLRSPA
jgi:3-hydroxyisobutyrate dehydrogenase-like beta-hydroxyacid dehydrogenase